MEKTRIYSLTPEQLKGFGANKETGELTIPDNFEVYVVPSPEDLRKRRIEELETELAQMGTPTSDELIEAGRMMHPYYLKKEELNILKEGV